jgi:DNA-directed RNA polymerase subunit RPC12/RpoP
MSGPGGFEWLILIAGMLACVGIPVAVVVILVVALRKKDGDRETRCRRCGYILRGISEPRCPECGERI